MSDAEAKYGADFQGEDDAASAITSRASKASYGAVLLLPVLFEGVKEKFCSACGEGTHSASPFVDAAEDDKYGGRRPWRRYMVCPTNPQFKIPHAKICLPCANTFTISGLELQHKTLSKYMGSNRGKPEEHRGFLKSVKGYIEACNENPDGSKAFLSKAIHDARTTVDEEQRNGTKLVIRRTFILEKTFQELYSNDPIMKKAERDQHFVTQKLGLQFGFWVPGSFHTELPGHFEYEDYEDLAVVQKTRHEQGDVQVDKGQAQRKFDALYKLQTADRAKAEQKMQAFTASDLLAMAGMSTATSDQSKGPTEEEVSSDDESENDDDGAPRPTLWARARGVAAPKAKSAGSQASGASTAASAASGAAAAAASKRSASASASQAPAKASKKVATGASAPGTSSSRVPPSSPSIASEKGVDNDHRELITIVHDGRFQRLKENLIAEIAGLQEIAKRVCDLSMLNDQEKRNGSGATFASEVKARSKEIGKSQSALRTCIGRITRSTNKDALSDQLSVVQGLFDMGAAAMELLKALSSSSIAHVEVLEAFQHAAEHSVSLSKTMAVVKWTHEALQEITYGRFAAACAMIKKDSAQVRFVESHGGDAESMKEIATALVEDLVMRLLAKLKASDFKGKDDSQSLAILVDFLHSLREVVAEDNFLAGCLEDDVALLIIMADCKNQDPLHVRQYMDVFDAAELAENLENASPLQCFLVQHDSGKLLHQHTLEFMKKSSTEIRLAEWCARVEELVKGTERLIGLGADFGAAAQDCNNDIDKMSKEEICKTKANCLRMQFHTRITAKVREHYKNRLVCARSSIGAWLVGDSEEVDILADMSEKEYNLSDKVKDILPRSVLDLICKEESAYRLLHDLMTHVCCVLRAGSSEPTVEAKICDAIQAHDVWNKMKESLVHEWEALLARPPADWHNWLIGNVYFWEDFIDPLQKWLADRSMQRLHTMAAFMQKNEKGCRGTSLEQARQMVKNSPGDVQVPFLAVVGAMTELELLESGAAHESTEHEQSGRPGTEKAKPAAKVNPWTLASKKEKSSSVERLTKHHTALLLQLEAWTDSMEAGSPPTLQRAGFDHPWLQGFVDYIGKAKKGYAEDQAQLAISHLDSLSSDSHKMVNGTPDPLKNEQKFLNYVAKHGARMAAQKGDLEKAKAQADDIIAKFKLNVDEVDTRGTICEAGELIKDLLHTIMAYTLLCLIRNPLIRSPKEQKLRSDLKSVRDQLREQNAQLVPEFLAEAAEILGDSAKAPVEASKKAEGGAEAAARGAAAVGKGAASGVAAGRKPRTRAAAAAALATAAQPAAKEAAGAVAVGEAVAEAAAAPPAPKRRKR